MSKYTTGELAKLCNVSVRTVQFYDTKGLLPPTELTDGGRRLYTDDDFAKLRLICLLKALGLSLKSIQDVLAEETPKLLCLLLDEQAKKLGEEMGERKSQLDAIKIIRETMQHTSVIPVNSITDIDKIMDNKKNLDKLYHKVIAIAIPVGILQWGSIILWIVKGIWLPFAFAVPVIAITTALLLRMIHKNRAFICAECDSTFKPRFCEALWASSTTQPVWKLTCTQCGHYGVCVEVYSKN